MRRPLAGVKVLDLGQRMAGPTAARLLGDNGADVLHIDPPGGWRWTAAADAVLNAGKSRLCLDFDDPTDLATVHRLVAESDVVVENFRPGALRRFGLDHAAVRTARPTVVYLSLPGFASADEEHADVAAYEAVIAAATGQFSDMGVNRVLMGIPASYSPLPLGSAYAGVFGAMAVALALRARLSHGQGEHIEVPIASSLLEALSYNSMLVADVPDRYRSRREQAIADGVRDLTYEQVQTLLDPFYRTYWCADDRPLYLVAVSHNRHPRSVLEALGLWDEAVAAGLPTHDPYLPTEQWPEGADCTIGAHPISALWSDWLSRRIAAVLRTRSSEEWEDVFAAHGVPAVGTRTTTEWLQADHAGVSGLLVDDYDPVLGPVRRMGPVVWTEPVSGGRGQRPSVPLEPTSGWLDGITVVDLTNVIAGPTIGSTLARFGATVIKVDPPTPTFDPWNAVLCGMHANRGKQSVLLDARSTSGGAALQRLIAGADVVTVNASEDQLRRLGLTSDQLAEAAPNVVLCQLDAWSGPHGGPWRQRPGYDDLVQAATGVMARFGGDLDTPEEHAHFGTIDVLAGLAAATATAFALYDRDRTGTISTARTSLAAAGQLIQAPYMISSAAGDEPSGRAARGESPTYRIYPTRDGWVFLVIPADRVNALATLTGFIDCDSVTDEELSTALSRYVAERTSSQLKAELAPLGMTVQPLSTLQANREGHTSSDDRPWGRSSYHFTVQPQHPSGLSVTLVAPIAVRPASARIVVPTDAPTYGEHTDVILTELGYDAVEIDDMVRSGAAGLRWSDQYLPD